MSIIYREEKGAPLSIEELDGNFRDLDERLMKLEKLDMGRRLSSIVLKGQELIFQDQNGGTLSTAQLPLLKLNPRGEWAVGNDYAAQDLVTYQNCAYLCLKEHKATEFNLADWQKLLDLPQPRTQTVLTVLTHQNLPQDPELGLHLLIHSKSKQLVPHYWNGKNWINSTTNEISKEI